MGSQKVSNARKKEAGRGKKKGVGGKHYEFKTGVYKEKDTSQFCVLFAAAQSRDTKDYNQSKQPHLTPCQDVHSVPPTFLWKATAIGISHTVSQNTTGNGPPNNTKDGNNPVYEITQSTAVAGDALKEGDDKGNEEGDASNRVHVIAQAAFLYVSAEETRCFREVEV